MFLCVFAYTQLSSQWLLNDIEKKNEEQKKNNELKRRHETLKNATSSVNNTAPPIYIFFCYRLSRLILIEATEYISYKQISDDTTHIQHTIVLIREYFSRYAQTGETNFFWMEYQIVSQSQTSCTCAYVFNYFNLMIITIMKR